MDIRKLQRAIVDGLEEVKAQNIAVFNTEQLTPLFERVIIASGTSNRQTRSLAASVRDAVKASGFPVLRTEGEDNGEWIIVDCGAAVAHIMQPGIRDYYHLEEIWGAKPVRMKLDASTGGLPKAGAGTAGSIPPVVKRGAAKKASAKKAAAKESPARKPPAKKPAAKPTAATKKSTAKGTAKPVATRTAAKKAAAKKTPRA